MKIKFLIIIFCLNLLGIDSTQAFMRGGSSINAVILSCTTNGSDGFSGAPAGTGQLSTLLSGYAATPNWCVAGVNYAIGPNSNATNSGNTITETGVLQTPVNADKRTLYAPSGGALPSGPTEGTQYFICGVSGASTTWSYTLNTSSGCGGGTTVALGTSSGFIILKVPGAITNVPTGTSGWNGADCGFGSTFCIQISGSSRVLDHWDFSQGGGWFVWVNSPTSPTVTNNRFVVGDNIRGILYDQGNNPTGLNFSYNYVDGNAIPILTTTTQATPSGNQITVASVAGLINNMTVCNKTATSSITCPGTLISNIAGNTITLSSSVNSAVGNGDTIYFERVPMPGGSFYRAPQITFGDHGNMVFQYNYVKDTHSEHVAFAMGTGSNLSSTFKYNIFLNTGWGAVTTGDHGDIIQNYGLSGTSFGPMVYDYNTVIQNNSGAVSSSGGFTLLASGTFGATATTTSVNNNVGVFPVGSGSTITSNFGLAVINPSWFSTSVTIQNNYIDPTSACPGTPSGCGAAAWSAINSGVGGGNGGQSPTCSRTGSTNMKTGGALPVTSGGVC